MMQHGYIALIAVLVMGAVAVTVTTALLFTGFDSQREVKVAQGSAQALQLATGCAEDVLQTMHDNTAFTGNGFLNLSTGTCTYAVVSTGANTRTVDATATINNVTKKIKVYVTINLSSLSITSWQDIN